jgi:hypothetical protein
MREHVPSRLSNRSLQLLGAFLALFFCGCAFLNRDNTPAFNFVEKKLWPEKTVWKIASSPVVVPLGLVAVITDAVVIHPASVVDDAAGDTGDVLWDNFHWDKKFVTACASIPCRGIATPPFFTGNFLGRSLFDIPSRASIMREERESAENLEYAKKLFEEDKSLEALDILKKTNPSRLKEADQIEYSLILFKAAHKTGCYDYFPWTKMGRLLKSEYASQVQEIMNEMKASPNPMPRWHYYNLSIRIHRDWKTLKTIISQVLNDPNPIIRYYGLSWFEKREGVPQLEDMIPELERIAGEDPDPMNRAYAGQVLRQIREQK